MSIWETLIANPGTDLRTMETSHFKAFVEYLPFILHASLRDTLTIQSLMKAQFLCVSHLAQTADKDSGLKRLKLSLSQHARAEKFLLEAGDTVRDYCIRSGMSDADYEKMKNRGWIIHDFLMARPAVILAPLLRR